MIVSNPRPNNPPAEKTDFDRSPLIVFYEITRACDLACLHCRACAQTEPDPHELTTSEALQLCDQVGQFPRLPMLVLTGGDPLCRTDVERIISHATSRNLTVAMTPSVTPRLTRAALQRLRGAGLSRVAVSLDGPDAAFHDRHRGVPGSFDRTLEVFADANELGLPLQVNTTLMPGNVDRIHDFVHVLSRYEIALWSVFFLVPTGRADHAPRLTGWQVEDAFAALLGASRTCPFPIKTTEAPHYRRYLLQNRPPHVSGETRPAHSMWNTNDGKGILFVGHTGMIYPSGFLPIGCGLFPLDHVVDVYQHSPLFNALRDPRRLKGKCGECPFRTVCGGSRARAYAVSGDPLCSEPDCAYLPTLDRLMDLPDARCG